MSIVSESGGRAPYQRPGVRVLGTLAELTQGLVPTAGTDGGVASV